MFPCQLHKSQVGDSCKTWANSVSNQSATKWLCATKEVDTLGEYKGGKREIQPAFAGVCLSGVRVQDRENSSMRTWENTAPAALETATTDWDAFCKRKELSPPELMITESTYGWTSSYCSGYSWSSWESRTSAYEEQPSLLTPIAVCPHFFTAFLSLEQVTVLPTLFALFFSQTIYLK